MKLLLGVIADDYTGATDIASTLASQGMRVTQVLGIPDEDFDSGDAQAIVVSLKSRTNPPAEAVSWSLRALHWLGARGARQILFKYCSTFDSTATGNIGPVADALLDALDCRFAFVCPAYPDNHRHVYRGYLFVGDELLSESSMSEHPLTPMHDSSLLRLLRAQSSKQVGLVSHEIVRQGVAAIDDRIQVLLDAGASYGVVDILSNADISTVGAAAARHSLITGGSAIAAGVARHLRDSGRIDSQASTQLPAVGGRALVIAGSCAAATLRQIAAAPAHWARYKLDLDSLHGGRFDVESIVGWARRQPERTPVLVYASASAGEVAASQARYGVSRSAEMVESALADIAVSLVSAGFARLIVAGGETSGAVVSALAIKALRIGPQIDPGVPWTTTFDEPPVALALKSGNFGRDDFFNHAFASLDKFEMPRGHQASDNADR